MKNQSPPNGTKRRQNGSSSERPDNHAASNAEEASPNPIRELGYGGGNQDPGPRSNFGYPRYATERELASHRLYHGDFEPHHSMGYRGSMGGYSNTDLAYGGGQFGASGTYGNMRPSYGASEMGTQQQFPRGPKGYTRSDNRIKEDVCDRIWHLGHLDASDVEVSVANAEVTLTGTVPNRGMKWEIEHTVDQVGGVVEIHNQLRVKR